MRRCLPLACPSDLTGRASHPLYYRGRQASIVRRFLGVILARRVCAFDVCEQNGRAVHNCGSCRFASKLLSCVTGDLSVLVLVTFVRDVLGLRARRSRLAWQLVGPRSLVLRCLGSRDGLFRLARRRKGD